MLHHLRRCLVVLLMVSTASEALAQHDFLTIDVTPTQPILPPQVGDYINNPGNFFTLSVSNKTDQQQVFYLCLQLEQKTTLDGQPASLSVSAPPEYPGTPFVVAPKGMVALSQDDMRRLFNHIPLSAMTFSGDLLSAVGSSDYGLLPEGTYRVSFAAYQWDATLINQHGMIDSPVAISNPDATGFNTFQVCYKAQAPQFTTPLAVAGVQELQNLQAVKLPLTNPVFTWSEPVLNCTAEPVTNGYTFTVKEVLAGQTPDEAATYNPDIFKVAGLRAPQCVLGFNVINRLLDKHVYVAQVTANQRTTSNPMDFTMVENQGKSQLLVFTPLMSDEVLAVVDDDAEPATGDGDDGFELTMYDPESVVTSDDSLYVFRMPKLLKPDFNGNTKNTIFQGNSIRSEWERPVFVGGKGERQDTLKFRYHVRLYNLEGYATKEQALEQGLIYECTPKGDKDDSDALKAETLAKQGIDVLKDYIDWDEVSKKVSLGQTLLLRVEPECVGQTSVRFYGDGNERGLQYTDLLSEAFGDACAGGTIENNRKPIDIADKEMKGKKVFVGEYEMLMGDDVRQDSKTHAWSGSGWMLWEPMGQKVKVGVKFDKIFINDKYVMYDGVVNTETKSNWDHLKERATHVSDTNNFDEWIPDDIFTEWGLDNLVGYATPDALKPYLTGYTDQAGNELNNLAQKVKASKYYDYVKKGYAIYDNFMQVMADGKMPDIEVFLPLQLPESVNKSPIDIQLISMEFHPTYAWMNLLGMFSLPDNDVTENNILMFGAPRMCMDPDRILPGSGNICLLEDLTLQEKSSGFEFTFKAPTDVENPQDGCMMSWANDTISLLSLKAEMLLPELTKCNEQGVKIEGEKPKATIEAQVRDWEDWWGHVTMDPFEADDLPGWTFTAQDIIYDHSQKWNPAQVKFPANYFDAATNENAYQLPVSSYGQDAWQGLYISKIAMQMPEGFLKNGNKRFEISATEMLVDKSGITGDFGLDSPVDCSIDDWALRVKQVAVKVQQNSFDGCAMNGDVHVPLTGPEDYIAFSCDMIPQHNPANPGAIDFLLKVQPTESGDNALDGKLKFDFFLADLELNNKQTYFLLEAVDQGQGLGYETRVELCMGGDITISATKDINQTLAGYDQKVKHYVPGLPFDLRIPGVHFTQMRLANCPRSETWKHGEQTRQEAAASIASDEATIHKTLDLADNHTYKLGDKCYFDCGAWSLASFDKELGPFKFSLDEYHFNQSGNDIELELKGSIGFLMKDQENPLVTATTTVALLATADVKNLSFSYKDTQFRSAAIDIDVAGIKVYGQLDAERGEGAGTSSGYSGSLKFSMPGDLFNIEASGGYYTRHEADHDFTYGWFYAAAGGQALRFDPIVVNNVGAGFYFNCVRNVDAQGNEQKATPKEGMIGVVAKLDLSSTDGELVKQGTFNMTALYDRNNNRLTSMLFTGELDAAAGMVKAKATIAWVHNDTDKYFQLNVTADVKADAALDEEMGKLSTDLASKLSELNAKYDAAVAGVKGGLENAVGVAPGEGTSEPQKEENKTEDFSSKGSGISGSVSLDLKITFMQNGRKLDKCKWHVYLGEPDFEKRCSLTLIDLKAGPVSVKVGANMYLCIGNELPNDGELPPIPANIANFLNGESKGGMEGADITKAQRAREASKKQFAADAEAGGGFMMGAEVYGYVDVDLGIFYGGLGVDAGFDVSVRKLAYPVCPQTSDGRMGHNGWYGEGQLYAYLAAKFGIHVNLGFWNQDFDIINAGIGGVLKCGLPHPNYFIGAARIKLKLLGGLVNINRRFAFECGTQCDIFYGNPLDNFELFGDCSLGVPVMSQGWSDEADVVDPDMMAQPRFETQAPLNTNFRVLDENSLHQLLDSYNRDGSVEREQLEMQARRTFVFRREGDVKLYAFTDRPDSAVFSRCVIKQQQSFNRRTPKLNYAYSMPLTVKDFSQTTHGLQLSAANLSPDYYYAIVVKGSAKEIIRGVEENPRTFHPEPGWQGNRWTQDPWEQTQVYYFRTGSTPVLDDDTPLQPYVAIAYPSSRNKLKSQVDQFYVSTSSRSGSRHTGSGTGTRQLVHHYNYTDAYGEDVICPTIALNSDIRGKIYNNGRLMWRLYTTAESGGNTESTLLCEAENHYIDSLDCLNMTPSPESDWVTKAASAINRGTRKFRIVIDYENVEVNTRTSMVQSGYQTIRVTRQNYLELKRQGYDCRVGGKVTIPAFTTVTTRDTVVTPLVQLMDMAVQTVDGTWLIGYKRATSNATGRDFVDYSKPFMGVKLTRMDNGVSSYNYSDDFYATEYNKVNDVPLRVYDPYAQLSWLGNYFFIGGHPIKNYAFETGQDANGDAVPVAESVVYADNYNVWSGNYHKEYTNNVYLGATQLRRLMVDTDFSLYGAAGHQYPLPYFSGSDEWCNNILLGGQGNHASQAVASVYPRARCWNALWRITAPYFLAEKASEWNTNTEGVVPKAIYEGRGYALNSAVFLLHKGNGSESKLKKAMQTFNNTYRGLYFVQDFAYPMANNRHSDPITLQVPMYQFPLVIGSQYSLDNSKGLNKSVPSLKGSLRAHSQQWATKWLYMYMRGYKGLYWKEDYLAGVDYARFKATEAIKRIKELRLYVYRVNAFNLKTMTYDCLLLRPDRYMSKDEQYVQSRSTDSTWLLKGWTEGAVIGNQ